MYCFQPSREIVSKIWDYDNLQITGGQLWFGYVASLYHTGIQYHYSQVTQLCSLNLNGAGRKIIARHCDGSLGLANSHYFGLWKSMKNQGSYKWKTSLWTMVFHNSFPLVFPCVCFAHISFLHIFSRSLLFVSEHTHEATTNAVPSFLVCSFSMFTLTTHTHTLLSPAGPACCWYDRCRAHVTGDVDQSSRNNRNGGCPRYLRVERGKPDARGTHNHRESEKKVCLT